MVELQPYKDAIGIGSKPELMEYFHSSLSATNRTYDFFVNWEKVRSNTQELKIPIALLGTLAGSTNPPKQLRVLLEQYPEASRAIPILIAVRDLKLQVLLDDLTVTEYDFSKTALSSSDIEEIVNFCDRTGIFSLLTSSQCLLDYVTGVEVGTDTNARKNRSGTSMESLVKGFLDDLKQEHPGLQVREQKTFSYLERTENIAVPASLKNRRFDIAVSIGEQHFNIETNFYSGTGSKPQEIVDSYINRQNELKKAGWKFIWITDGNGWSGMSSQVDIAFTQMDYILNLALVREGVLSAMLGFSDSDRDS